MDKAETDHWRKLRAWTCRTKRAMTNTLKSPSLTLWVGTLLVSDVNACTMALSLAHPRFLPSQHEFPDSIDALLEREVLLEDAVSFSIESVHSYILFMSQPSFPSGWCQKESYQFHQLRVRGYRSQGESRRGEHIWANFYIPNGWRGGRNQGGVWSCTKQQPHERYQGGQH